MVERLLLKASIRLCKEEHCEPCQILAGGMDRQEDGEHGIIPCVSANQNKRENDMPNNDRLLVLLQTLQSQSDDETWLTTAQLRAVLEKEGHECSIRTLRRDMM